MSAVQTLKLDARQRAMLDEMGVKVWWPVPQVVQAEPEPVPVPVQAAPETAPPEDEYIPTAEERMEAEMPVSAPPPPQQRAPAARHCSGNARPPDRASSLGPRRSPARSADLIESAGRTQTCRPN